MLSKCQSLSTTILFRTTVTQKITLNLLMKWLLGSNLSQATIIITIVIYYFSACHWGYYYYFASVEYIPWCCCWKVSIFTSKEKKVVPSKCFLYLQSKSSKFCPLYIQAKLFLFPLEWLNSKEDCSFHSWKWLVNITTYRPFYGLCAQCSGLWIDLWPLTLFCYKPSCFSYVTDHVYGIVSIRIPRFALEKKEGL